MRSTRHCYHLAFLDIRLDLDLSGHFCDLPIIMCYMGKKSTLLIALRLAQAFLSGIISYRTFVDNSRVKKWGINTTPPKVI